MEKRNRYGYFSEDGKEYIITRPDTPRPWANHLSNEEYGVYISNTGGGLSTYRPPDGNQLTAYSWKDDRPGKYIYIRDNETKIIWSATYQPVCHPYEDYKCIHAPGYSVFKMKVEGISSFFRIFIPLEGAFEFWTFRIKNETTQERSLTIFPFVEWYLAGFTLPFEFPIFYSKAVYMEEENLILATYTEHATGHLFNAFFACDFKIDGYDCQRKKFLGLCGDYCRPQNVMQGISSNTPGYNEHLVGVFRKTFTLKEGEEKEFNLLLGYSPSKKTRKRIILKYLNVEQREVEFNNILKYYEGLIEKVKINTPDKRLNRFFNIWLKYQVLQCVRWYRGPVLNVTHGFRDILQDIKGLISYMPEVTKERLLKALKYQYSNGRALRQWSEGAWPHDDRPYSDSPIWIIYTLCSYLKDTGDFDILEKEVEYFDGGKATVYEHAVIAVKHLCLDLGEHGLPRVHGGDWQDNGERVGCRGHGESVWLAMALVLALYQMEELAEFIQDNKNLSFFKKNREMLIKTINEKCWDGKWYLRYFDDDGKPIGSRSNKEGKLWIMPQIWGILSGVANRERIKSSMEAVEEKTRSEFGYQWIWPAFTHYYPNIGSITAFYPRNCVYLHPNAMKFAAECKLGDGDKAFKTLSLILPYNHSPSKTHCEPYVFPNFYTADKNEKFGQSLFSWMTGTASWVFSTIIEELIGIKAGYDSIIINPVLPSNWEKVTLTRDYRGARYIFTITKPFGPHKTVKEIRVNGKRVKENKIPFAKKGTTCKVEVEIK